MAGFFRLVRHYVINTLQSPPLWIEWPTQGTASTPPPAALGVQFEIIAGLQQVINWSTSGAAAAQNQTYSGSVALTLAIASPVLVDFTYSGSVLLTLSIASLTAVSSRAYSGSTVLTLAVNGNTSGPGSGRGGLLLLGVG